MKKPSLEKLLYLKGYTTANTSNIKIKAEKGLGKAFLELYYQRLENKDIKGFMDDINEFHGQEFWESKKKKSKEEIELTL